MRVSVGTWQSLKPTRRLRSLPSTKRVCAVTRLARLTSGAGHRNKPQSASQTASACQFSKYSMPGRQAFYARSASAKPGKPGVPGQQAFYARSARPTCQISKHDTPGQHASYARSANILCQVSRPARGMQLLHDATTKYLPNSRQPQQL
eukprot:GHUV01013030.1.p3 GENE.GHUV01013030.1~~GHUV01013030.1.p3  ORF type:complete len:149 (-),score=27.30 GHUV01013030.1:701-1147(-)